MRRAAGDAAAVHFTHRATHKPGDHGAARSIIRANETQKLCSDYTIAYSKSQEKMKIALSIDEVRISVNKGFYVVEGVYA